MEKRATRYKLFLPRPQTPPTYTRTLDGQLMVAQSDYWSWTVYRIKEDYDDPLNTTHEVVAVFSGPTAEQQAEKALREMQRTTLTEEDDE